MLAAAPPCPKQERAGTPEQLKAGGGTFTGACGMPMTSLAIVEKWTCPRHGPMMTWEAAAEQQRRDAGGMYFQDAA